MSYEMWMTVCEKTKRNTVLKVDARQRYITGPVDRCRITDIHITF